MMILDMLMCLHYKKLIITFLTIIFLILYLLILFGVNDIFESEEFLSELNVAYKNGVFTVTENGTIINELQEYVYGKNKLIY